MSLIKAPDQSVKFLERYYCSQRAQNIVYILNLKLTVMLKKKVLLVSI